MVNPPAGSLSRPPAFREPAELVRIWMQRAPCVWPDCAEGEILSLASKSRSRLFRLAVEQVAAGVEVADCKRSLVGLVVSGLGLQADQKKNASAPPRFGAKYTP